MPDLNYSILQHHRIMNQWWADPRYRAAMVIFKEKKPTCDRCGRPTTTALHTHQDYLNGFEGYLKPVVELTAEAGCNACNLAERSGLHPCPSCVRLYHLGKKEKIRYIPEQSEVCGDCRDPEDKELQRREQEQFKRLIKKRREEQNARDKINRRPYLDEQNRRRRMFYRTVVKKR